MRAEVTQAAQAVRVGQGALGMQRRAVLARLFAGYNEQTNSYKGVQVSTYYLLLTTYKGLQT